MLTNWDQFRKRFDTWEGSTAKYLEQVLRSPLVLGPSGALVSAYAKAKAQADLAKARLWGELGLPTKRDQERALHLLQRLESRLLDLEERLDALEDTKR